MAACESCGASLRAGAATCDLCGTPVGATRPIDVPAESAPSGALCPSCGHRPPPGSTFCNACGTPMPAGSEPVAPSPGVSASPSAAASSRAVGTRALAVIGFGLLVVLGLYGLTVLTPRSAPEPPPVAEDAVGPAAAIPDGAPPLPDSLQTAADRFAALGTAEGFYESGRYYLTAAFQAVQTDPTSSVRWARQAIAEFERSLALADDPRVRVALAEAATFDPSDPMRPIQELRAVLEADPGNLDATFLLAERRMMIGRVDSARAAFERVVAEAPAGTAVRQRAQEALARLDAAGG